MGYLYHRTPSCHQHVSCLSPGFNFYAWTKHCKRCRCMIQNNHGKYYSNKNQTCLLNDDCSNYFHKTCFFLASTPMDKAISRVFDSITKSSPCALLKNKSISKGESVYGSIMTPIYTYLIQAGIKMTAWQIIWLFLFLFELVTHTEASALISGTWMRNGNNREGKMTYWQLLSW